MPAAEKWGPSCARCRFFDPFPGPRPVEEDQAGLCRRLAPRSVVLEGGVATGWPTVDVNDWCGEFTQR